MAERADIFWNRGKGNTLLRIMIPIIFGFTKKDRFTPDLLVRDGFDLSQYGIKGCIVHLQGHSKGSIGVLTASGDLICGDMLMNDKGHPSLGYGEPAAFEPAINRLRSLDVKTIYPGHGKTQPEKYPKE
jgi:glyoxylase-like metal-dependent hydrolase (beta-lactamase superfamily II)